MSTPADKLQHDPLQNSRLRIHLAEDDEDDYVLTRDMLAAAMGDRFELDWSTGFGTAMQRIREQSFDLYLVDQRLGDGEGVALVGEIHAINPGAPILILTGIANRSLDDASMQAGASDFLVKSELTPTLLERSIRHALDHKRSEQALLHSQRRFRDMLRASSDWFWELDAELRYTEVSDRFFELTGLEPAEVIGTRYTDSMERSANIGTLNDHTKAIESRSPFRDFSYPVRCPDGQSRWIMISGVPIFDDRGTFTGYRGTGADITGEILARRSAALAQVRLADAISSISEAFALWDANDRLVIYNRRFGEEFDKDRDLLRIGIDYETFVRERVSRRHVIDADGDEERWISERLEQHRSCSGTVEMQMRDGRWKRVTERRTKDGGTVVIRTDITELKRREQALRASEHRFRDMLEAASDWYSEWNADMLPVFMSKRFFELTGYTEEDILGKPAGRLIVSEADPEALEKLNETVRQRRPIRGLTAPIRCADGRVIWISMSGKPVYDDDGTFLGYRGTGTDITEGTLSRHSAELAQKRLLDAIECITDGFSLFDKDGRLMLCNENYRRSFEPYDDQVRPGVSFESLVRLRVRMGVVEARGREEAWIEERTRQRLDPDNPYEFELSDGRWLRSTGYRTSEGGEVLMLSDITRPKRREAALAESEHRWHAIFDRAAVGIASIAPDGGILAVNEALADMLGRDQASLTRSSVYEVAHPEDVELCARLLKSAGGDAGSGSVGIRYLDAAGETVWTETESASVSGDDGKTAYFVAVIRDVTETKRVETELTRLGRIVDESLNEVYLVDIKDFHFHRVNRGASRNLGYDVEALTSMTPMDIAPHAGMQKHLDPLIVGDAERAEFETHHRRKDGSEYPVHVQVQLSRVSDPPVLVSIVTDLSERKAVEARLRQAQKMEAIGQLAGGIAHDFNNVLTVVSGNLGLLAREIKGVRPDTDWDDLLEDAISAAKRARELTKSLLSISRKDQMVRRDVDVGQVIEEVRKLLHRTLPANVVLQVTPSADDLIARTDENYLHTAILNLGLNARDAMPDGGTLTFNARRGRLGADEAAKLAIKPGDYVVVEAADSGAGMEPWVRERVLDPLFTTKAHGKGTGLGLTMVSNFVRESGGDIGIRSEVGAGTTVSLYLPASNGKIEEHAGRRDSAQDPARPARLLVVDDDEDVLRFVVRCLERAGFEVLCASDAGEALSLLSVNRDVSRALLDIQLPGDMDGIALATRIMDADPHPDVMLMTASGNAREAALRRFGPGTPVLKKPFSDEELTSLLESRAGEPGS